MTRHAPQIALLAVLAFILGGSPVTAQDSGTKAAQESVESWLTLVDSRRHAASWEGAATVFENAITKEKWQAAVESVRGPLGQLNRGR
jgi:hypothetical protein